MAQPFIGEIRQVGFNFPAVGWFPCDGRLLSIADYETLFVLIGTTYGGDGVQTFGIPNLAGRVPINQGQLLSGSNYVMGQMAGVEQTSITIPQMASHTHAVKGSSALGAQIVPTTQSTWSQVTADGSSGNPAYANPPANVTLSASAISSAGSSLPVSIMQPYVVINFMIAYVGIFPSQN
jgi:microcystin-dependent protein